MHKRINAYDSLVEHYEHCFAIHGDCAKGVDWPNLQDLQRRYQIMLELVKPTTDDLTLLDFGCGTAMFYEYLQRSRLSTDITYAGVDMGASFVACCREKYPDLDFYQLDILHSSEKLPSFDYIVMNGVLTEKRDLSYEQMWQYSQQLLSAVFDKSRRGIAFNVMSKLVDWERDDLFHLSIDILIDFLARHLSRNFVIRNDYGLYEYTVYVYR